MAAEQSWSDLQVLLHATTRALKQILNGISDLLIYAIAELALNLLHNQDLNIPASAVNKIKKHKKVLSVLASPTETLNRKRYLTKKLGHKFLPALLRLTIPHVPRNGLGSTDRVETTQGAIPAQPEPTTYGAVQQQPRRGGRKATRK